MTEKKEDKLVKTPAKGGDKAKSNTERDRRQQLKRKGSASASQNFADFIKGDKKE